MFSLQPNFLCRSDTDKSLQISCGIFGDRLPLVITTKNKQTIRHIGAICTDLPSQWLKSSIVGMQNTIIFGNTASYTAKISCSWFQDQTQCNRYFEIQWNAVSVTVIPQRLPHEVCRNGLAVHRCAPPYGIGVPTRKSVLCHRPLNYLYYKTMYMQVVGAKLIHRSNVTIAQLNRTIKYQSKWVMNQHWWFTANSFILSRHIWHMIGRIFGSVIIINMFNHVDLRKVSVKKIP